MRWQYATRVETENILTFQIKTLMRFTCIASESVIGTVPNTNNNLRYPASISKVCKNNIDTIPKYQ